MYAFCNHQSDERKKSLVRHKTVSRTRTFRISCDFKWSLNDENDDDEKENKKDEREKKMSTCVTFIQSHLYNILEVSWRFAHSTPQIHSISRNISMTLNSFHLPSLLFTLQSSIVEIRLTTVTCLLMT